MKAAGKEQERSVVWEQAESASEMPRHQLIESRQVRSGGAVPGANKFVARRGRADLVEQRAGKLPVADVGSHSLRAAVRHQQGELLEPLRHGSASRPVAEAHLDGNVGMEDRSALEEVIPVFREPFGRDDDAVRYAATSDSSGDLEDQPEIRSAVHDVYQGLAAGSALLVGEGPQTWVGYQREQRVDVDCQIVEVVRAPRIEHAKRLVILARRVALDGLNPLTQMLAAGRPLGLRLPGDGLRARRCSERGGKDQSRHAKPNDVRRDPCV